MTTAALPPGPSSSTALQGIRYFQDPTRFLDTCAARFGDIFTMQFPGSPKQVCLSTPADLKLLYTGDPEALHAGEAAGHVFAPLTGWHCTLTLDGAEHAHRRQLTQIPFHGDRLGHYAQIMREVVRFEIQRWPRGEVFSLHTRTREIALRIIFRVVLGLDDRDPGRARFLERVSQLASLGMGSKMLLIPALRWDAGPYSPWGRIVRIVRDTDALLFQEIERRRAAPRAEALDDVLSVLLHAEGDDGRRLSDRELRDEIVALLIAGVETTATALTWVLERVAAVPEVQGRLTSDVASHLTGKHVDSSLDELPYLDAVIKESLRFRALSPICGGRVVKAPLTLRDYRIPPGTVLLNCPYLLHRREALYPDPDMFRPERFLDAPVSPYAWTPFGGGTRRCLGHRFALLELKTVIAIMLSQGALRLATPRAIPRPDGIHLLPAKGLPVRFEPRTCPARAGQRMAHSVG